MFVCVMPPCFHPRFLAYRITPSPYSCPTCALPGRALCSSGAFCHSHLSPSLFLSFPGPMSAAHVSNRGRVYGRGPPHVRPSLCARSALTTPPKNTQTQTRRQTDRQTRAATRRSGATAPHRARCGLLITPGPYLLITPCPYLLIHRPPPHHALSAHGPLPQFSVTHY